MAPSLTRGPLPAKVYWRRRALVLGTALALVFAVGRLLGGGSDGASDDPAAQQVAGRPSGSPTSTSSKAAEPTKKARPNQPISPPTSRAPELAVPDGPCVDDDVLVTPVITEAVGGGDVAIQLDVRTVVDEACTWRVSPAHLTVAITSGADDIWSSQQCPKAIPVQDLVVRSAVSAAITVVWNGKRSDEDCSKLTGWAMPGYYHVAAAALGGEPVDVQFRLTKPDPEIVVETPDPEPTKPGNGKPTKPGDGKPTKPTKPGGGATGGGPAGEPSGAVEPNG